MGQAGLGEPQSLSSPTDIDHLEREGKKPSSRKGDRHLSKPLW